MTRSASAIRSVQRRWSLLGARLLVCGLCVAACLIHGCGEDDTAPTGAKAQVPGGPAETTDRGGSCFYLCTTGFGPLAACRASEESSEPLTVQGCEAAASERCGASVVANVTFQPDCAGCGAACAPSWYAPPR